MTATPAWSASIELHPSYEPDGIVFVLVFFFFVSTLYMTTRQLKIYLKSFQMFNKMFNNKQSILKKWEQLLNISVRKALMFPESTVTKQAL